MKKKKLLKILKAISKAYKECDKHDDYCSGCPFYDNSYHIYCLANGGRGTGHVSNDLRLERIKELEEELNVSNK